jgi:hypothetical protein
MNREIDKEPWLDIRSYGRAGPTHRIHLSPAQAQTVARTAGRTPEVMVKVLSGGAASAKAVQRHMEYIGRKGDVELLTDEGDALKGRDAAGGLPDNWNLDLEEVGSRRQIGRGTKAKPARLAHKLVFSMPPGTNPDKVLSAVQNLCREEFALKHRYVMALHTDSSHPHVHVVLKAKSEQGKRLNIHKATLKEWREKFADHLRAQGVAANATPRALRDKPGRPIPLRIFWQSRREQSQERASPQKPLSGRAGRETYPPRSR